MTGGGCEGRSTKGLNPSIDLWLTKLDSEAHVTVVAEDVGERVFDADKVVELVVESAKKGTTAFEELGRVPWAKFPGAGTRISLVTTRDIERVRVEYGLWVKGNRSYQVMAFVSEGLYPLVKDDLEAILESFEPAP
ncbi:MAG: hypothetical protein R3B70_14505 [Polyangiaceae bacterium]